MATEDPCSVSIDRLVHFLIASIGGYFWLPCPRCGRMFGGHERKGGTDLLDAWPNPAYGGGMMGLICCKHCPGDRFVGHKELTA